MIIRRLFRPLTQRIPLRLANPIISTLFRRKNEEEAAQKKQREEAKTKGHQQQKEKEGQKVKEDEEYDFSQRRREIDTGVDFAKMRQLNTAYIPEGLGTGGIAEVLYWSQSASTPEQVREMVEAFNRTQAKGIVGEPQLQRFKSSVAGSVYLVDSLKTLQQYAIFALRFELAEPEFWEKMEFKCLKFLVKTKEDVSCLVDIVFAMGQYSAGQETFNYAQKLLADHNLSAEQYIKLFLVFSNLKRGQKVWVQKLLQGIADTMKDNDAEQLTAVLGNLKQAKKLPEQMNERVQAQVDHLLPSLTLPQLLSITNYFGFQLQDTDFWGRLQAKLLQLLAQREMNIFVLQEVVLKGVLSYRLSTDFVRVHILPHLTPEILQQMPPRTLSAISKALYIYQLQEQTKEVEEEIGKLLIGKITQDINQLPDDVLVKVIQDYNLTRHGSREIYIFFEEVIKLKFLRHYNPELDRNTIQLLVNIYQHSGMCSREMLDALHNLILD